MLIQHSALLDQHCWISSAECWQHATLVTISRETNERYLKFEGALTARVCQVNVRNRLGRALKIMSLSTLRAASLSENK